ncbi:MAG: PfkB family carbohydrate kinase [Anaerolineaceae bacterium]
MFKLLPSTECYYDEVSLGEVMLRLDPGENRIRNTRHFTVWEGGGEYNVSRSLKRCFGLRTMVITALADNDVGHLLEDLILQGGVDPSYLIWKEADGIGKTCRTALNFTERGFGVRGAISISDRYNTAACQLRKDDVDWDEIFAKKKTRWFHTGGIYAGISESAPEVILEAMKTAKRNGTVVSYDLNYRSSLWKDRGGIKKAQEVNQQIVPFVDVLIGNEEDFHSSLGIDVDFEDSNYSNLDVEKYKQTVLEASRRYPNLSIVASTMRTVKTANKNDWKGICYFNGQVYQSKCYESLDIFDRVGGGDSFASGFIFGLLNSINISDCLDIGIASGALAMTTPGDCTMATKEEVFALVEGKTPRIQR